MCDYNTYDYNGNVVSNVGSKSCYLTDNSCSAPKPATNANVSSSSLCELNVRMYICAIRLFKYKYILSFSLKHLSGEVFITYILFIFLFISISSFTAKHIVRYMWSGRAQTNKAITFKAPPPDSLGCSRPS